MTINFSSLDDSYAKKLTESTATVQAAKDKLKHFEHQFFEVLALEHMLRDRLSLDCENVMDNRKHFEPPPRTPAGDQVRESHQEDEFRVGDQLWSSGTIVPPTINSKGIGDVLAASHENNCKLMELHQKLQRSVYHEHTRLKNEVQSAVDALIHRLLCPEIHAVSYAPDGQDGVPF